MAVRESWKEIKIKAAKTRTRYAVSDQGRIRSFSEVITDGKVLRGTMVNGYPALKIKIAGKDYQYYIHKLVALYFLKKPAGLREFVIHLDHKKANNNYKNLKWASRREMLAHQQDSPRVQAYRSRIRMKGHKLTAARVKQIKQMISGKNRRVPMKTIAMRFGISEMQLYRIRSGENWGHI